jgi:hypothetical protein
MRPIFALALLPLAGCDVDNDSANGQVRLEYNQQRIEDAAEDAKEIGAGVGNVAASAGRAVRNEVGDIDVDVDVTRNRSGDSAANEAAAR